MKSTKYAPFLIVIMILSLLSSCGDDECIDGNTDFFWTQNRSIELVTKADSVMMNDSLIFLAEYFISDGEHNLFEYVNKGQFCRDIVDSGGSTTFFMLVPIDSTESFSYRDQEIIETAAFLEHSYPFLNHSVEEGQIYGAKIDDDSWRISINVVTKPQDYSDGSEPMLIIVDEIFRLQ